MMLRCNPDRLMSLFVSLVSAILPALLSAQEPAESEPLLNEEPVARATGRSGGDAAQDVWRHVVEDEGDAILAALVRNAVGQLVIELVSLADLEAIWPAVDDETHARVGGDRHVN